MTLPLRPQDLMRADALGDSGVDHGASFYAQSGKRWLDVALTLVLVPVAVLLVLVAALVLRAQGQQPFYSQMRLGQGGKVFRIWKLRTMRPDADEVLKHILATDPAARAEWNSTQKLKRDPRVTAFGAVLRKTSVDELPQLWNVLRGEMSLIGPRPMMLDQIALYGPALRHYLTLRPGISGKWQVTERNDADFHRRAMIDTEYAREVSFGADFRIFVATLRTILRSTGH